MSYYDYPDFEQAVIRVAMPAAIGVGLVVAYLSLVHGYRVFNTKDALGWVYGFSVITAFYLLGVIGCAILSGKRRGENDAS